MKNYLIVLARGMDGCGVSKNSVDMYNYLNSKNDCKATLIANNDYMFPLNRYIPTEVQYISFTKEYDKLMQLVDEADVVITTSVPMKKAIDETKVATLNMFKYIKEKGKKSFLYVLDWKKRTLNTCIFLDPNYKEMYDYVDGIFVQSKDGDFVQKFLIPNNINVKTYYKTDDGTLNYTFGFEFDAYAKYRKPFSEKTEKTVKFIGHSSPMKGTWKIRDFHWKYLKDRNYITTEEGIEVSIGTLPELYTCWEKGNRIPRPDVDISYIKPTKRNKKFINEGNCVFERNHQVYYMPPYDHADAMKRLASTQFGIEFPHMPENAMTAFIENAMFEIIAVGCVPVFNKLWSDSFNVCGKTISQYGSEFTGTVIVDEDDPTEALKLMDELSTNEEKYNLYRDNALAFYKKYFDLKTVFDQVFNIIDA